MPMVNSQFTIHEYNNSRDTKAANNFGEKKLAKILRLLDSKCQMSLSKAAESSHPIQKIKVSA